MTINNNFDYVYGSLDNNKRIFSFAGFSPKTIKFVPYHQENPSVINKIKDFFKDSNKSYCKLCVSETKQGLGQRHILIKYSDLNDLLKVDYLAYIKFKIANGDNFSPERMVSHLLNLVYLNKLGKEDGVERGKKESSEEIDANKIKILDLIACIKSTEQIENFHSQLRYLAANFLDLEEVEKWLEAQGNSPVYTFLKDKSTSNYSKWNNVNNQALLQVSLNRIIQAIEFKQEIQKKHPAHLVKYNNQHALQFNEEPQLEWIKIQPTE